MPLLLLLLLALSTMLGATTLQISSLSVLASTRSARSHRTQGDRILSRHGGIALRPGTNLDIPPVEVAVKAIAEPTETMSASEEVVEIRSPSDLETLTKSGARVVLQCKARGCRPCMAFNNKFIRMAAEYPDVVFAEVYGDASEETRRMMIQMKVATTPSFYFFDNGKQVHKMSGANKENLINAIETELLHEGGEGPVDGSMDDGSFRLKFQGA